MTSKRVAGAAAPGSFTPIQVASHPKNTRETYRVLITEFKGRKYIDARVWAGRDDVEMTATTKGLSLKFADAAWLHNVLGAALEAAKAHGHKVGGTE